MNPRHILAYLLGGIEALLLTRLVLRLLAARPDNPVVSAVLALTAPVQILSQLDAGQPRFGAVLELSTLAWLVLLPCVALLIMYMRGKIRGHTA